MRLDPHVRVQRRDALGRHLDLGPAHVGGAVEDLALQVGGVDHVEVDDSQGSHPGGGQVLGQWAAQPAGAHQQHPGLQQRLLPLDADLGQGQVALVALVLVRAQLRAHARTLPKTKALRPMDGGP